MIPTPLERLKVDTATQTWWQGVIDHPHFPLILDALREKLELEPPKIPETTSVLEACALAHAAHLGVKATLKAIGMLGSRYYVELQRVEEQRKHADKTLTPARAGVGYGQQARRQDEAGGVAPSSFSS